MMKKIIFGLLLISGLLTSQLVTAAADLEINTPAISAIQSSMQSRHGKLVSFYSSGAVGLTKDGLIAVKDASAVPLKDRQSLNSLVAAENADRNKLYKEIAAANAHPEWEAEIRSTFAQRWIQKAQSGWYYQDGSGWVKR
jgi:uncharacterized protein YdbL (DUF1318 family)